MGNCYILASLDATSENTYFYSEYRGMADMFIDQHDNYDFTGVNGLRFYIRGKPWVVDVDNYLLF